MSAKVPRWIDNMSRQELVADYLNKSEKLSNLIDELTEFRRRWGDEERITQPAGAEVGLYTFFATPTGITVPYFIPEELFYADDFLYLLSSSAREYRDRYGQVVDDGFFQIELEQLQMSGQRNKEREIANLRDATRTLNEEIAGLKQSLAKSELALSVAKERLAEYGNNHRSYMASISLLERQLAEAKATIADLKDDIVALQKRELSVVEMGCVYIVRATTGQYKIGKTRNLAKRLGQLQTGMPFKIKFIMSIVDPDMDLLEQQLHHRFSDQRLAGEWFNLGHQDLESLRREFADKLVTLED